MNSSELITGDELQAPGSFEVRLASVGNPDFGQDSNAPMPGVPAMEMTANSLEHASKLCRAYMDEYGLGGGNWAGGEISVNNKVVANVSFNGRVWREPVNVVKKHTR